MSADSHPNGRYQFVRGISPYSCGVAALPGHEIVEVTFTSPLPFQRGLDGAVAWLEERHQPPDSLCAVTLRTPAPMPFDAFAAFNRTYRHHLAHLGVVVDDPNPLARTNVAPLGVTLDGPVLLGFAVALPAPDRAFPTFVVAGAAELREGALDNDAIVRSGESSEDAIADKAAYVLEVMGERLAALQLTWGDVTVANVYTRHPSTAWHHAVAERLGEQLLHGITWYPSTPPVTGLEFEMDVRAPARRLTLHHP